MIHFCKRCDIETERYKPKSLGHTGKCKLCERRWSYNRSRKEDVKLARKNIQSTDEWKLKNNAYRHTDIVKARTLNARRSSEVVESKRLYDQSESKKLRDIEYSTNLDIIAHRKIVRDIPSKVLKRKFDYEQNILNIANNLCNMAKSTNVNLFIEAVNKNRLSMNKPELKLEMLYQYVIYFNIVNNGIDCRMEVNDGNNRYDLVLDELKIIIEVKCGNSFTHSDVEDQIRRYQDNSFGYEVLCTEPSGLYDSYDMNQLLEKIACI
jgi:hypothetical protein